MINGRNAMVFTSFAPLKPLFSITAIPSSMGIITMCTAK